MTNFDSSDIKDSVFTHHFVDNELLFMTHEAAERLMSQQTALQVPVPGFHVKIENAAIDEYIRVFEETGNRTLANEAFFNVHREYGHLQ